MEEYSIKVQGVCTGALAGVGLTGEVNVRETSESNLVACVYVILLLGLIINMFNPVVGVEMIDVISSESVSRLTSSFWRV